MHSASCFIFGTPGGSAAFRARLGFIFLKSIIKIMAYVNFAVARGGSPRLAGGTGPSCCTLVAGRAPCLQFTQPPSKAQSFRPSLDSPLCGASYFTLCSSTRRFVAYWLVAIGLDAQPPKAGSQGSFSLP